MFQSVVSVVVATAAPWPFTVAWVKQGRFVAGVPGPRGRPTSFGTTRPVIPCAGQLTFYVQCAWIQTAAVHRGGLDDTGLYGNRAVPQARPRLAAG